MELSLFEIATMRKYRFNYRGSLSVEDLWDINLEDLNSIYGSLVREKRKIDDTESLIATTQTEAVSMLDNKIAIVKRIYEVRNAQIQAAAKAQEDKEFNRKILDLIASKEDDALKGKSIEELRNMLK